MNIEENITSPTFTIMTVYKSVYPLYHIDLYRLSDSSEIEGTGILDILGNDGISVVEWADKAEEIFDKNTIYITIRIMDNNYREITVEGRDF